MFCFLSLLLSSLFIFFPISTLSYFRFVLLYCFLYISVVFIVAAFLFLSTVLLFYTFIVFSTFLLCSFMSPFLYISIEYFFHILSSSYFYLASILFFLMFHSLQFVSCSFTYLPCSSVLHSTIFSDISILLTRFNTVLCSIHYLAVFHLYQWFLISILQ